MAPKKEPVVVPEVEVPAKEAAPRASDLPLQRAFFTVERCEGSFTIRDPKGLRNASGSEVLNELQEFLNG